MSFTIALRAATEADPTCDDCPDGADLAITVFFPGVGNGLDDRGRIDYRNPKLVDPATGKSRDTREEFLEALGKRIAEQPLAGEEGKCCVRWLYEVDYDPSRTARVNAHAARREIGEMLRIAVRNAWVCRIHVHLLGFSAGGIVALNVAEGFTPCKVRRVKAANWCKTDMPTEVEVEVDVVTMATPFGSSSWLAPVFDWFVWFGRQVRFPVWFAELFGFHEFGYSLGENDYGGTPGDCVCAMVSLVSAEEPGGDDEKGDDDAGDSNPREDHRVTKWKPVVVSLEDAGVTDHTHDLVPLSALANPALAAYVDPGCRCVHDPM